MRRTVARLVSGRVMCESRYMHVRDGDMITTRTFPCLKLKSCECDCEVLRRAIISHAPQRTVVASNQFARYYYAGATPVIDVIIRTDATLD